MSICINSIQFVSIQAGPSEAGGRGVNCPPTFAENGAKLVNNRQISAEIWFLPPHFWVLTPHFLVPSEGPDSLD